MRYAIYFTLPADHTLTIAGSTWLGRDGFTGLSLDQPVFEGISVEEMAQHTAFSRRYAFHGTIVAPFRLATGVSEQDLNTALKAFSCRWEPFTLAGLAVGSHGSFIALHALEAEIGLNALAADAVQYFEPYRASLSDEEIKRRNPDRLSPRQQELLGRWGYPYVMDQFLFHMTLAGPLPEDSVEKFKEAAAQYFAPAIAKPIELSGLAVFSEPDPRTGFKITQYVPLGASD